MSIIKRVAVSVGDLNGIGIEIILRNHWHVKKLIDPIYCINKEMLNRASKRLNIDIPDDFKVSEPKCKDFKIKAGKISKKSGIYSYASFKQAVKLAKNREVDAVCTLPIHKKAWELAGIKYKGHTDALRDFFSAEAIMMLGCQEMFVALYTEHIPLRDVSSSVNKTDLTRFLIDFYNNVKPKEQVAVLGLNPHAGDDGVLGDEEIIIQKSIDKAHKILNLKENIYTKPIVPDIAFIPQVRVKFKYYIAMYHDQGLAPLKALYFDEGINVSLNLPILRTSVDHGTAFDIAYKSMQPKSNSYINAIKYIVNHTN